MAMFRPLTLFNRNRNTPALREDVVGDPFFQLHREMNNLFEDFVSDFGAPSLFAENGATGARPVHIEFTDTDKAIKLEAELPGVDEDDIQVELSDNLLTIRGEKKVEEEDKDKDNGYSRRAYSSFQRSMSLPFDVDPDAVDAKFKNGVLKLTLPKPPELDARARKIAIQHG
jgi:HSP20 family protein